MRKGIALFGALALLLLSACGGGDGGDDGLISDRILRLGEELDTVVEVRSGEEPRGMTDALNPGATADTPARDLIRLRVHDDGELLGSFRIAQPDGAITFYLLYDIPADDHAVEQALVRQLDETPWQVIAGQSTKTQSAVRFQSTLSGDIEGTAFIRPIADAEDGPLTNVVYIVEVRPQELADAPDFELPRARPLPAEFPAPFLVLDGMTAITVLWTSAPAGDSYQLVLLTTESAFDIAGEYRERLQAQGWELTDDRAVGFATELDFQAGDGTVQGRLSADAFGEDASYTSVVLELQTLSRPPGN